MRTSEFVQTFWTGRHWTIDDWLDEFDVDSALGIFEYCIFAFRDPINFQMNKTAGKMYNSYVVLFYNIHSFSSHSLVFRFFNRFRETSDPGCPERYIHTMDFFFIAGAKE
jgi:hypothetical protein